MKKFALAGLSTLALSPLADAFGPISQEEVKPPPGGAHELLPPVRLAVDGEPIDVGDCVAHAGPNLVDIDGDGKVELVVGDFLGHFHVHQLSGEAHAPTIGEGKALEINGEVAKLPNW